MTPTEEIITTLNLKSIPEVQNNTWHMFDDGGVEIEVGEFLYSLVRTIKPEKALETGLYSAISCMYMAMALRDNDFGHLDTVEYESKHIERSKERLVKMNLQNRITIQHKDSREFKPQGAYQFMFLDTEPNLRFDELVRFYSNLDKGGYVFIHDLSRNMCQGNINPDHPEINSWPFGDLPEKIKQWISKGELKPFALPTPRGLWGFYKKHNEDYL